MADGEVVLAAVDPGEGNAVLVFLVNLSTGELAGSVRFVAPRLRGPARDEPLLAGQAELYARKVAAEAEAVRAALLHAEAEPARRRHLRALAADAVRAALLPAEAELAPRPHLPGIAANEADARAALLPVEAEPGRRQHLRAIASDEEATRAAFPASEAERGRVPNLRFTSPTSAALLPSDLVTAEGASAPGRNFGAALVVEAGGRRFIVNLHHAGAGGTRRAEAFDRILLAVGIFPAVPNLCVIAANDEAARAEFLAAEAERSRVRNLRVAAAAEATSAALMVTAEGARPRDRNLGDELVVQAGGRRIVLNLHHATARRAEAFDRGLPAVGIFPAVQAKVFSADILIASGGAAALLQAAARRVFGRDLLVASDGAHGLPGPFFASVEAQVLGGARGHLRWGRGAHATLGGFRYDAEFFDRLPAPGRPGSYRNSERAQIRVFHAGADGTRGPLIAATDDPRFGDALLAAAATSICACGRRGLLDVDVTTGAQGQVSENVIFRGRLIASRGAGSNDTMDGFCPVTTTGVLPPPPPQSPPPSISNFPPRRTATHRRKPPGRTPNIKDSHKKRIMVRMRKDLEKKGCMMLVKFKSILGDFVWFAVPQVLLFYPRKTEGTEVQASTQRTWLEVIHSKEIIGFEKPVLIILFVIFVSIWVVAILLATFGKGKDCVAQVGRLTYLSVISVVAFIDYMLYKTTSEDVMYQALFIGHFCAMVYCITCIWAKHVKQPLWKLPNVQPKFQWMRTCCHPSQHQEQERDPLRSPLLQAQDMV